MGTSMKELHLFIIWKNALNKKQDILADIRTKFSVIKILNINWSDELFAANMTRFYGQNLPDQSFKEQHCGKGEFCLIVVEDESPLYRDRVTTHGKETVNSNMFDSKRKYRDLTGGGHRIHGTDNIEETKHNLVMLLGLSPDEFVQKYKDNSSEETISCDLTGATGWDSIEQLLVVINHLTNYVIMRNFEPIPKEYTMESHGDIDLLCDDPFLMKYILNAEPIYPGSDRVLHNVLIKNEKVLFDFRFVGDNYYDSTWQKDILKNRVMQRGFYRPSSEDYFYTLLYHALVQKPHLTQDYYDRLQVLAHDAHIKEPIATVEALDSCLQKYMLSKGYNYVEANDVTVYINQTYTNLKSLSVKRVIAMSDSIDDAVVNVLQQPLHNFNDPELLRPQFVNHFSNYKKLLLELLDLEGKKVVELESCSGLLTKEISILAKEVIAVEKNEKQIEAATIRCNDRDNITHVTKVANTDDTVDTAIFFPDTSSIKATDMNIHQMKKKIAALSKILSEDGEILFGIGNTNSIVKKITQENGLTLSKEQIHAFFLDAGFCDIEFIYPFPNHVEPQYFISEKGVNLHKSALGIWAGSATYKNSHGYIMESCIVINALSEMAKKGLMSAFCPSYIVRATKKQHNHIPWMVEGYTEGRREHDFRTTTNLLKKDGKLVVTKTGSDFEGALFEFCPPKIIDFYDGETLSFVLMKLVLDSKKEAFFSYLQEYANYLEREHAVVTATPGICGDGDVYINGNALDVHTGNIVIEKDGAWKEFDNEWRANYMLPLSLIIYRGMTNLLYSVGIHRIVHNFELEGVNSASTKHDVLVLIIKQLKQMKGITSNSCKLFDEFEQSFRSFAFRKEDTHWFIELYVSFFENIHTNNRAGIIAVLGELKNSYKNNAFVDILSSIYEKWESKDLHLAKISNIFNI